MMDANLLLEALEPLLDGYQRLSPTRRRLTPIDTVVAEIYHVFYDFCSEEEESDDDHDKNEEEGLECLSEVLLHVLDCTLAMESTADSKESIEALFRLVAAVAVRHCGLVQDLLERAVECSTVLLERIRASACKFLGHVASFLVVASSLSADERHQLLDQASQALIPRLTDKAQSVRLACLQAAAHFFASNSNDGGCSEEANDDPDLRLGLQWCLQHDPSVTNRVAALSALPVTIQTSDLILSRLRDVKPKVRMAAMELLYQFPVTQFDAEQCAAIVEAATNDRCLPTKEKAEALICTQWMKELEFDPIRLLQHIGLVDYEESCAQLVRVLLGTDRNKLAQALSRTECQSYWDALESAGAGLLDNKKKTPRQVLDLTRLFYTRVRCQWLSETAENEAQKEDFLSPILPDIPTLAEQLEVHALALIKVMVDEEQQTLIEQSEDEMACVCLNLLQLFGLVDFIEHGARLHLQTVMKRMLSSLATPDDLVEGCTKTLRHVFATDDHHTFWQTALEIIESLCEPASRDSLEAELQDARTLRILSLICVVCEISAAPLSQEVLESFSVHAFSAITHGDSLIQEAAVVCLGRLGIFGTREVLSSKYVPALSKLVFTATESDEEEEIPMAIRAKALLALTDWALVFTQETGLIDTLLCEIPRLLQHEELFLQCIAAEVAVKLLFSRKVIESEWLGKLVLLLFDPRLGAADGEDGDEEEHGGDTISDVGNPERLQQLLSLFFPAFCLQGQRDAFVGCVSTVLDVCLQKDGQKRKRGVKALPVAKMLDYILATADCPTSDQPNSEGDDLHNEEAKSNLDLNASPSVLVALQLASFIAGKQDDCSATLLRTLCKHLGKADLHLHDDTKEKSMGHLSQLAGLLEQLSSELTDEASLQSLEGLNEALSELDFQEDTTLASDNRSVAEGVEQLHLADVEPDKENHGENRLSTPTNDDNSSSTQKKSARRQRRTRSSSEAR